MQKKLSKCICKSCGQQWPSEAAKKRHEKCHKNDGRKCETEKRDDYEDKDEFCQQQDEDDSGTQDRIPVINNITDFLATPFQIITRLTEPKSRSGRIVKKPARLKD